MGESLRSLSQVKKDLHPMKTMNCAWWDWEGLIHWEMIGKNMTVEKNLYIWCSYTTALMLFQATSTFKTSPKSVRMLLRTITNHFRILPDCKTQGIMEKSQRDLKHIRSKKCLPNSTIFSNDKTVVCNLSLYINCFIIFVIKFYTKFKKKNHPPTSEGQ